jgi:hypothetical protein
MAYVRPLTPPIEMSTFTLFFLAAKTNLVRSSSPPEIDSSSTEGVVSLIAVERGQLKYRRQKLDTHANE